MIKFFALLISALTIISCSEGSALSDDDKSNEEKSSSEVGPVATVKGISLVANLGDWTPADVNIPGWVQGLVVYGGYAVIFHDGGQVVIYDLNNKSYFTSYYLPNNTSHCNNAALGLQKYYSTSLFPMVYVSDCVDKGDCYVYDLKKDLAREVQRIKLKEKPAGENGGNGWFIDEKNQKLGMHWNDNYYFFDIPDMYTSEATVSVSNLPPSGKMKLPSTHQGSCAYNGYIFFPCGFNDDPYVTIVRISDGKHMNVDLSKYGIVNEPEGICEYNGSIYLSCGKSAREALLYKIDLTF